MQYRLVGVEPRGAAWTGRDRDWFQGERRKGLALECAHGKLSWCTVKCAPQCTVKCAPVVTTVIRRPGVARGCSRNIIEIN